MNVDLNKADEISEQLLKIMSNGSVENDKELRKWVEKNRDNETMRNLTSSDKLCSNIEQMKAIDAHASYQKLAIKYQKRRAKVLLTRISFSAAVMVALSLLIYFNYDKIESQPNILLTGNGNSVIMKLTSGNIISLNEENTDMKKLLNSSSNVPSSKMNQIIVPTHKEFNITLSDSTKVWINAGSTLSFPDHFAEENRIVELNGEAYFEVAKDIKRPFIVKANHLLTRVLGTKFYVSSYNNDKAHTVSLVNGVVEVSSEASLPIILQPSKRFSYNQSSGSISVETFDVSTIESKRNGQFVFDNLPIDEIANALSRWYGIEIISDIPASDDLHIYMTSAKSCSVDEIMANLEATGLLKCNVRGNKIIITKN